jgi:hypothetical protein
MSLMIAVWGSGAFGGNFIFFPDTVKRFLVDGFQLSGDRVFSCGLGSSCILYLVSWSSGVSGKGWGNFSTFNLRYST